MKTEFAQGSDSAAGTVRSGRDALTLPVTWNNLATAIWHLRHIAEPKRLRALEYVAARFGGRAEIASGGLARLLSKVPGLTKKHRGALAAHFERKSVSGFPATGSDQ